MTENKYTKLMVALYNLQNALANEADTLCDAYNQVFIKDETRPYNCGGILVELTLPNGEHEINSFGYYQEYELSEVIAKINSNGREPLNWNEWTFSELNEIMRNNQRNKEEKL
jgi:hypothetical protein